MNKTMVIYSSIAGAVVLSGVIFFGFTKKGKEISKRILGGKKNQILKMSRPELEKEILNSGGAIQTEPPVSDNDLRIYLTYLKEIKKIETKTGKKMTKEEKKSLREKIKK